MHGPRNNKFFHIVAINSKQRRDAKPIETLGIYRPKIELGQPTKTVEWSAARIKYWLGVGAQPSKSAVKLFTMGGIIPPDSKYHGVKSPSPSLSSSTSAAS
ncbi:ribosomal S16 [Pyrrhoderma noxium]|uniref:Ribosomal S16 n=1 Tax=Pyrrhoderma noxium TaxID=2282107 RepID=A0A286US52_9AGAM|nr:ribosomal S16 [Pyrrhoderma noxium]